MAPALERRLAKLHSVLDVSRALAAERRLDALLARVVDAGAQVAEADRCTLFLVDRERGELWSKVAHGAGEIRIPLGSGIAGAAAASGAPVRIDDAYADPRFHQAVDVETGYRTRNLLAVPMKNTRGEVVGVLQALNRAGGPFTDEDEDLLGALAGPAASAVENAILNEEIEGLFEGFVKASVVAIESRDPTTAGHSSRVSLLTVNLARAVEAAPPPGHAGLRFDVAALDQLRYAALLHDFGKVGVREHVLVKADKLFPGELALVRARFDLARACLENEALRARLEGAPNGPGGAARLADLDARARELEALWEVVALANRPTVLAAEAPARLAAAAAATFRDPHGEARPLLTPDEVALLSIPRGSLSDDERREIESHVAHTFRFLSQIPWTRELRRVPEIAGAHHEKLDGRGYPHGTRAADIPVEAKLMTIADIYDALTASDRPYKKALPIEKALDILADEAKRGQIDAGLLGVFVGAGVFHAAHAGPPGAKKA